ncbi:hypothetical protein PENTCL1PPCAC_7294, partial [Pristionchus entomophagus]
ECTDSESKSERSKINLDSGGLVASDGRAVAEGVEGGGGSLLLILVFLLFSLILDLLRLSGLLLTLETLKEVSSPGLEGFLTRGVCLNGCSLDGSGGGARLLHRGCCGPGSGCDCCALLLTHHTVHPHSDASPLGADVGDEVVLGAAVAVLVLLGDGSSDVEGSGRDQVSSHVDLLRYGERATTEENALSVGCPAHAIEDVGIALASNLSISALVSTGSTGKGTTLCLDGSILVDGETVDHLIGGALGSTDGRFLLRRDECDQKRDDEEGTHL